jgi:YVTN family beta-propeller protein
VQTGRAAGAEPRLFGRYRLERLVGSVGTGEVYEATDLERDRLVTLELFPELPRTDEVEERLRRASRLAARLRDPHVVPIHDYGEIDRQPYVEMRLLEDCATLTSLLSAHGALPPERALRLAAQIAEALDAAHLGGLVHGDLTPSNVLVTSRDFVYVADFGIAHAVGDPEVDSRSDIASLAWLLRECVTVGGAASPALIAPDLDAVLARALATDPDEGYPTAGALAAAVRGVVEGSAVAERPPPRSLLGSPPLVGSDAPSGTGWSPLELVLGAVVLVVAVLLAGFTVAGPADPSPSASPAPPPLAGPVRAATSHPVPEISDVVATPPTPGSLAITTDGVFGYVANRDMHAVTVLNLLSRTTVATIPMPATPRHVALDRAGMRAFVTCWDDGGAVHQVTAIDMRTYAPTAAIPVNAQPGGLALAPDERTVWVPGRGAGSIDVVSTDSDTVLRSSPVGPDPSDVAFAVERAWLVNGSPGVVSVLDPDSATVLATVPVGRGPRSVAPSPDGSRVAVANHGDNTVSVIDTSTNSVVATVPVGHGPHDVTYAPDGRYLYTANADDGSISAINASTNQVSATVQVGGSPTSVATAPGGRLAYVSLVDESRLVTLSIGH